MRQYSPVAVCCDRFNVILVLVISILYCYVLILLLYVFMHIMFGVCNVTNLLGSSITPAVSVCMPDTANAEVKLNWSFIIWFVLFVPWGSGQ
jgi:hypothetical protein